MNNAADFKSGVRQSYTNNQRFRASFMPRTALLFLLWASMWATAAEPFTASTTRLRDYLIIRPPTSQARFPLVVCRADLYDVPAGTMLITNAWLNATNNSNINNPGLSCELHLCDPVCPSYDTTRRFDRVGGVGMTGGSNLDRSLRHHEALSRYGRISIPEHVPHLGVELQCKAYATSVVGNQEWIRVDDCGVDVWAIAE